MRLLLTCAAAIALLGASAQSDPLPRFNVDDDGLWVDGYDPVSYTVDHRAAKGDARFSFTYGGAIFHFVSPAHRDLFAKAPASYLPAYGGWCAYAMGAKNEKVVVDPETFKLKDGRVFLFYNRFFTNTLEDWNKAEDRLLPAADRHWAAFKHRP
ncbi:MAG: YHS domain protein [Flavobacteriales bacterium]|jgi:YHS domain-containing protein|nr:YHS domain protein [Flavobacteriales bacterium]MBK7943036.1 YHS domain protein [Flavobacteriales bacterium]MBK8947462.1 YHS domain protein [Flavobacteriales bacterium]MBK9698560.1 YHS domain protein [Flavobacteriales bacterium]